MGPMAPRVWRGYSTCHLDTTTIHHHRLPALGPNERLSHAGADGPLTAGKKTLAESLSSSGFIDPAASLQENFAMCLKYQPPSVEIGDLKPGMLKDLVSWVKSKIAAQAQRSAQAQAHVSPEAAVKLLT